MKKLFSVKGLIISVLSIFVILNILWFGVTKIQYKEFLEAVPEHKLGGHSMKKDGISYNVKTPDYLSYVGNLGILDTKKQTALIIWPKLFGEDKYGFRLQSEGEAYEIVLNSKLEPIDDSEFNRDIVESNREVINEMMTRAKSVFPLD